MDFGAREGLTWREAWDQMPDGMQAWVDGDETQIPGSETHVEAGERFAAGLTRRCRRLPADGVARRRGARRGAADRALLVPRHPARALGHVRRRSTTARGRSSRRAPWRPDTRWRLTEWNAGTLPVPVMSDEE